MKEDREQTKLDFLEYAVTHLENRIGLLDKIASILIAIQTGFFVLVAFVLKYVLGGDTLYFQVVGYTFLLGLVLITALVIILLIWTIRPTKNVLGLKTHVDRLNEDENVMWFSDKFPQSAEHYKERVESPNIQGNYENAHFVALQLLKKKYACYRWAVLLMKVNVIWSAFVLLLNILLKISAVLIACGCEQIVKFL